MPEKLPRVIYMQKDDPAMIPSWRHRNALGHMGWSQLSLAISDIGLRGLTLLCRERFVTHLKFCHTTFPKPSPDQYHRSSLFRDGHNSVIPQWRQWQGYCGMLAELKGSHLPPTALEKMWNQRKPTVVQLSERRAEAQHQIYATLST